MGEQMFKHKRSYICGPCSELGGKHTTHDPAACQVRKDWNLREWLCRCDHTETIKLERTEGELPASNKIMVTPDDLRPFLRSDWDRKASYKMVEAGLTVEQADSIYAQAPDLKADYIIKVITEEMTLVEALAAQAQDTPVQPEGSGDGEALDDGES